MGDGGVVDGKQLQHALSCLRHQINHHLQVAEVAYASTLLGTEREYWDKCSSQLAVPYLEESLVKAVHHRHALLHVGQSEAAVTATFPHHHVSGSVGHHELQLYALAL